MNITGKPAFDKTISWGVIVTLAVQLIGFVVFLTKLDARVENIERAIQLTTNLTTKDGDILLFQIQANTEKIVKLENSLERYNGKLDEILYLLGGNSK